MCEIVNLSVYRAKHASSARQATVAPATTFVLIPSARLSKLREFWAELKAEISADEDPGLEPISRR